MDNDVQFSIKLFLICNGKINPYSQQTVLTLMQKVDVIC